LTISDIDYLLDYADNKHILTYFPVNPVSSFLVDSVTVGHVALWTVESIRIASCQNSQLPPGGFPSLNPMLGDTSFSINCKFSILDLTADKYKNWWRNPKDPHFRDIHTCPLEGTTMVWR